MHALLLRVTGAGMTHFLAKWAHLEIFTARYLTKHNGHSTYEKLNPKMWIFHFQFEGYVLTNYEQKKSGHFGDVLAIK